MPNEEMSNNPKYDLEERTAKFGENGIRLCLKITRSPINDPLITQFVKCTTSVGANYCEADDAESKEDFHHKIGICKKETRESKHFIRMLVVANPRLTEEAEKLAKEAKELNLIFNTIYKKTKKTN
jgi:four helix bundle protein